MTPGAGDETTGGEDEKRRDERTMTDVSQPDPGRNKPSQAEGSDTEPERVSPQDPTDKPSQAEGEDPAEAQEDY